jgi:hypothetical protein
VTPLNNGQFRKKKNLKDFHKEKNIISLDRIITPLGQKGNTTVLPEE